MRTIAIVSDPEAENSRFLAQIGDLQSTGKTMGEALDALASKMDSMPSDALVLIQKREPDRYFTAEQLTRMHDLMSRRHHLTPAERAELETLVDAELDATVARTDGWWKSIVGIFKDDPEFDEAMRLGAEYRDSLRDDQHSLG